jgi:hypothetical protein
METDWEAVGGAYLIEEYGRHEETRTPDLYRVKGKLTCISNDFEGLVDRVSTSKYLQGGPITGVDHGCEILGTFGAACMCPKRVVRTPFRLPARGCALNPRLNVAA